MRIRFIKNYGYILPGSTPDIGVDAAKQLIRAGYAVEIGESESDKNIEQPQKDKMVRKTKRK